LGGWLRGLGLEIEPGFQLRFRLGLSLGLSLGLRLRDRVEYLEALQALEALNALRPRFVAMLID
jgi:hypothetical protein